MAGLDAVLGEMEERSATVMGASWKGSTACWREGLGITGGNGR